MGIRLLVWVRVRVMSTFGRCSWVACDDRWGYGASADLNLTGTKWVVMLVAVLMHFDRRLVGTLGRQCGLRHSSSPCSHRLMTTLLVRLGSCCVELTTAVMSPLRVEGLCGLQETPAFLWFTQRQLTCLLYWSTCLLLMQVCVISRLLLKGIPLLANCNLSLLKQEWWNSPRGARARKVLCGLMLIVPLSIGLWAAHARFLDSIVGSIMLS